MPLLPRDISSDLMFTAIFGGVCGLVVLGVLLLWTATWLRQFSARRPSQAATGALTVAGMASLLVGVYSLIPLLIGPFCIIAWPVLTLILLASAVRYVRSESRALVAMLAVAAERGIPLTSVARDFAEERSGFVSSRAARLADYLNAAVPLAVALKRSGAGFALFPPELLLAADVGERTGTLGVCLSDALAQLEDLDRTRGSVWEKSLYVGGVILIGIAILTFVMIKIVPVFAEMFDEFGIELPAATRALINMSATFTNYWYVTMPFFLLICLVAGISALSYVGVSMRSMPIIHRMYAQIDNAIAMRMLALTIQGKQSVVEGLHLLAGYFPLAHPRRQLDRAAHRASQGVPWQEAMQSAHLIKPREANVLLCAERAGNLAWALDELARTKIRRWTERVRGLMSFVFPFLILLLGIGVMFVSVSLMLPLIKLISVLS